MTFADLRLTCDGPEEMVTGIRTQRNKAPGREEIPFPWLRQTRLLGAPHREYSVCSTVMVTGVLQ